MRFTIERLRALVLAAGVLLIAALAVLFVINKWKHPLNRRDLPSRLGVDIQQEASGFTYTQARGGHTLFKIQASKVVQLKKGTSLLHEVRIELYGPDGSRMDRIEGNEFEYDQEAGTARANGPVEIALVRPAAVSGGAKNTRPSGKKSDAGSPDEVHVKTSGLVFDQNSGLARTGEPLEFELRQGRGSAHGATFDSQQGLLVLDRAVKLEMQHGAKAMDVEATHAEFESNKQVIRLTASVASYQGNEVQSAQATIQLRGDGSAEKLDATDGFVVTSAAGSRLAAPMGTLQFDEENQPRSGVLRGGVTIDSDTQGRKLHGGAPMMALAFTPEGVLRSAHLERGVKMESDTQSDGTSGALKSHESWTAPEADLSFRDTGHGHLELAEVHGTGGVVVTDQSQRGDGPVSPFRMSADAMAGTFGAGSALTSMTGTGHAEIDQTTATGTRQSTSGDRLVAHFVSPQPQGAGQGAKNLPGPMSGSRIETATVEGRVVLVQQPPARPGTAAPGALRATAGKAVYVGEGGRLRLTGSPRVEDGGLQLSALTIDVTQATGDAIARGAVKATWMGGQPSQARGEAAGEAAQLGGQGPAHAIADEADMHQTTGEVVLRGHARLWQMTNSIAAPGIVLDRTKQTLVARATGAAEPVQVVMVSAAGPLAGPATGKTTQPSVIRMQGGDLKYSAAERKAVMRGGALGRVRAETADMASSSNEVELTLLPPGNRAGKDGSAAQVDRMTARGQVELTAQGRVGTGEQLDYSSDTGEYVLTGTSAQPPRLVDATRGTVTGEALIFNTRDDSVKVESAGHRTTTEATAPAARTKRQTGPR
ncbi:MAG: LptA/OstA family protein [Terracidiphilus sp.]